MMDTPSSSDSSDKLPVDFSTKLIFFSHEFPCDDLQELFRYLQRNSKKKRFPLLATFLADSTAVLKEEALKLPQVLQDLLPVFNSQTFLSIAADLAKGDLKKGPLGGALEGALLCILEIGMLIGHYEGQNLDYDIPRRNTTLAAMSIGLFAGAACAISSSLSELAYTGAESVRLAFRFCVHVDQISEQLEPRGAEAELRCWAYVVTGLSEADVQKELDRYNAETHSSEITKVCISHSDKHSVGVTGPPTRIVDVFRQSEVLRYSKHSPLPIHAGLCHTGTVYNLDDVDAIMNGLDTRRGGSRGSRPVYLPLISPHTGLPFAAENAGDLFELICSEALTKPLYLDNLISGILHGVANPGMSECQVFLFRTSIISNGLLSAIETHLPEVPVVRHDLIDWAGKEYPSAPLSNKQSKLAVVGMSCRLPGGANDTELFWKLLMDGRDTHTTIPADRFDLSTHYDPTGKTQNSTETPFGNFIEKPGLFDAAFFNMSPREAEQTDPMHRLALVTAYEALEMAGFAPNRTPSTNLKRVGTFYGVASDDYREVNAGQIIGTYGIPGGERAFANGRINYFFKFGGPSFNIDTACSSGGAAVNAACSALWSGEADTVIAGGLNVITNPDIYCMLSKGHFLSKTGQCKVWDKEADGYCRADGVGSVVIKRLEDAEADNDNILATIVAGTTNHSAEAISITHPHAGAQKDNFNQVMQTAGINPLDVSYVELHGTGTQAGDAVESESVAEVFAPITPPRRADQRLNFSAVKSNIGHGEAAAGVTSLIKVLIAYQKNEIPRHIGIRNGMNPVVAKNMEKRNAGLCMERTPWLRLDGKKRYAIVNSFGAHGGNTTFLLEDAPEKVRIGQDPRPAYVVTLSAKSKASLKGNLESLISYLDEYPDTQLGDLSYTTCARRMHHHTRIATSVTSTTQLRKFLESSVENTGNLRPIPAAAPPVAFAFTGQGAFYDGAGAQLFRDYPVYRKEVLRLDRIVQQFGFPSVVPFIEGPADDSASPIVTQLTILVLEIALARFWEMLGVKPNVVIGHSLGEYAAMVAANVLSAADAIFLVGKRAELIIGACKISSHVMLSVRASVADTKKFAGNRTYEIACMNGQADTVISGTGKEIQAIRSALESNGVKCLQLELPFAFHSAQLDPMLDSFEEIAKHIVFKQPSVPIVSPLLGQCIFDGKTINAKYLRRASREPVNFIGALDAARDLGIIDDRTIWIDNGPHPLCGTFIRSHNPKAKVFSSLRRKEDNFVTVTGTLAALHCEGLPICWNEWFRPYEKAHCLLQLKQYKWNEKNYWITYEGTWSRDKGQVVDGAKPMLALDSSSSLKTSSIHQIISEEILESTGKVAAISDVMRSDLFGAVNGHVMNGVGVVTASIWSDMALTLGEYLYQKLVPRCKEVPMNVTNMTVTNAQIAQKNRSKSQIIQIEGEIDLATQATKIHWYTVAEGGVRSQEFFATATVLYEDPTAWQAEWRKATYLLNDRIETLDRMAAEGTANKLSKSMAYNLFRNVVDYTDKYCGMQSVVLNGFEAYADIVLVPERHGTWHTPPHWIDSVFHLAGFVMNGSDASNTKEFFYITPGWSDFRLLKPLASGIKYRSYVRMFQSEEDPNMFAGDIYAMQEGTVVAVLGQIRFRRVPRLLMERLFVAPDVLKSKNERREQLVAPSHVPKVPVPSTILAPQVVPIFQKPSIETAATQVPPVEEKVSVVVVESPKPAASEGSGTSTPILIDSNPVIADCLRLIARETGLDVEEFSDEASFVELGIDSLMSLVLSEKFRTELRLEVQSSIFLECPSVKDLKEYLEQYC